MTDDQKTIPTQSAGLSALRALFGDEEQAIVLRVDEHEQLLDYEVRPLGDVVIDLVLNGFGKKTNAEL